MPAAQVSGILQQELGVRHLKEVFEWIDLDEPLGSASLAQVRRMKGLQVIAI